MANRFIEGFDGYSAVAGVVGVESRWLASSTANLTLVAGRFDGQAIRGTSSSYLSAPVKGSPYQQGALGVAVQIQTASALGRLITLSNGADAPQITIAVDGIGRLLLYRGSQSGTFLAASTVALSVGVWYYIEVEFRIDDPAGYVRVYVNGGEFVTYTGNTIGVSGNATFGRLGILGASSVQATIDDIYVEDGTIRLGEARVQTQRPAADTAQKDFTPSSGTSNYSRVNENLVDGDASYVASSTVGDEDLYDLADMSATPQDIFAVQVRIVARKDDAATRAIKSVIKSGATVSVGEEFFLSSSYTTHTDIYDVNPDTGVAWTKTDVDNLQIGQRVTV